MRYFNFYESQSNVVYDYPDDRTVVFPATRSGIKALRNYANYFTSFAEAVGDEWNLYSFEAEEPMPLPFPMNLNYTDIRNAKKLDHNNLQKAIQIMSKYDEGHIINMGEYMTKTKNGWEADEPQLAYESDYSREHLITILSSIIKTIAPVVINPSNYDLDMEKQVVVSRKVRMIKIEPEEAHEFLIPTEDNPLFGANIHDQEIVGELEDEEDEYGFGGDWWK